MESLSLRENEGPGKRDGLPPQDLQGGAGAEEKTPESCRGVQFEKVQSRTKTIEKEGPVWPLVPSLEALFEMALPIV